MGKVSVKFLMVHSVYHVCFYGIPRLLKKLLIRLPRALLRFAARLLGVKGSEKAASDERAIAVLTPEENASTLLTITGMTDEVQKWADPGRGNKRWEHNYYRVYHGPLYNRHFHTVMGGLRPPTVFPVEYVRENVLSTDGQHINIDFTFPSVGASSGGEMLIKGVIVIVPGLLNSSSTNYIRHFVHYSTKKREVTRNGYVDVHDALQLPGKKFVSAPFVTVVINYRGFGSAKLEVPKLFAATFTEDIRCAIQSYLSKDQLRERITKHYADQNVAVVVNPMLPVVGVGFSLGGTILNKYVGEEGKAVVESKGKVADRTGLDMSISFTSPLDLLESDKVTGERYYSLLYEKPFALGLRRYIKHNRDMFEKLTNVDSEALFGVPSNTAVLEGSSSGEGKAKGKKGKRPHQGVDEITSIRKFDTLINAPHNNFGSVNEYYTAANSLEWLRYTAITSVAVVNTDDPLVGRPISHDKWREAFSYNAELHKDAGGAQSRKGIVVIEIGSGGHLGYVGTPLEEWRGAPTEADKLLLRVIHSFADYF